MAIDKNKVQYDSDAGEVAKLSIDNVAESLRTDILNKISVDFAGLKSIGLFKNQLETIEESVKTLTESCEALASSIKSANKSWQTVANNSKITATNFRSKVSGGSTGKGGAVGAAGNLSIDSNEVDKGKEISNESVKELVAKMDSGIIPVLLKKIAGLSNDEDGLVGLFTDESKSDILTTILKRILGYTGEKTASLDMDTKQIQKALLSKINKDGIDITTAEGKAKLREYISNLLKIKIDDSLWYKTLYGDNVVKFAGLDGTWVVANTNNNLKGYVSFIEEKKVYQAANQKEWGDSCLSFAETYAYDLSKGTSTDGAKAASYAYSASFKDFINDNQQVVLSKIYDEITSGKPVVLQVNGNSAGSIRHFVTVVGFKEGVISGATLKPTDLLIIDSWDGKIERMDTKSSRFLTSGRDCGKEDYSGFRIRVMKS